MYLVFGFDDYYPCGGMGDCVMKTNSLPDAFKHAVKYHYDGRNNDLDCDDEETSAYADGVYDNFEIYDTEDDITYEIKKGEHDTELCLYVKEQ